MTQFINFNTVIGNGKAYQVPLYQRDYSWEKDHWEDIEAIPQDKSHYLGYLVLQPLPDAAQSYLIIDGQQRIATLSLLSLAVAKLLKDWAEAGIDTGDNLIRKSAFQMTKDYLLVTEWSPATLAHHQQKMAKWAKSIWRSSYLS